MSDCELREWLKRLSEWQVATYDLCAKIAQAVIIDPAELAKLQAELKTSADTLAAAVAAASTPKSEGDRDMGQTNSLDVQIAALQAQVAANVTVEGSAVTL